MNGFIIICYCEEALPTKQSGFVIPAKAGIQIFAPSPLVGEGWGEGE